MWWRNVWWLSAHSCIHGHIYRLTEIRDQKGWEYVSSGAFKKSLFECLRWDAQDVFYACKSRTERGGGVHDCVVQGHAALLCVNIGVCACVFHCVTEEIRYSVWKLQPVCSCQCSWLAFMQRFCPLSA